MSSEGPIVRNPGSHFRILGMFWTFYGVIRLLMVLCMIIYDKTVTLMFGALLSRVPDPFALMGFFRFLYAGTIVLSFVCGLVGIVAGLALLGEQRSGRKLALIAAVLSVSDIPLGTTLGIYTLVKLLPIKTTPLYGHSGQAA